MIGLGALSDEELEQSRRLLRASIEGGKAAALVKRSYPHPGGCEAALEPLSARHAGRTPPSVDWLPSGPAYSLAPVFDRTRIGALSLLKLVGTQPGGVKFLSGKMTATWRGCSGAGASAVGGEAEASAVAAAGT
jgi:hypothetical protein